VASKDKAALGALTAYPSLLAGDGVKTEIVPRVPSPFDHMKKSFADLAADHTWVYVTLGEPPSRLSRDLHLLFAVKDDKVRAALLHAYMQEGG